MLQTVGLMGGELTCLKQGPGVTPHGVQANGRQIMAAACSGCKGRFPVEGGNDVTLTHRVTRVTSKAGGARPRGLFDQKRHELGGGQVCREISEVSRGHPENKRTATLTVLTVHSPGRQGIIPPQRSNLCLMPSALAGRFLPNALHWKPDHKRCDCKIH